MRVIIAGSREITDIRILLAAVQASGFTITEVVEGGARGVDRMAREWARANLIPYRTFDANWDLYGKKAGPIRNREMAAYGEALIAIPSSVSRGTQDMIRQANVKGLQVYVHRVNS